MNVCTMMTEMAFTGLDREEAEMQTVCDPWCGTVSMLLPTSNYSLRLYGQDIAYDLCLCAELNVWLWMLWLAYVPAWMSELFETLDGEAAPGPQVRLETETGVGEDDVWACREGRVSQSDFFGVLGSDLR